MRPAGKSRPSGACVTRATPEPDSERPWPDAMGSEALISQITNLSILATLATDISADSEYREDAFVQGMYAGGPTIFFAILRQHLATNPPQEDPWEVTLRRWMAQPHVVLDATKIGNLGHFVVFRDPSLIRGHFVDIEPNVITWEGEELPRRLGRLQFLDSMHVPALMRTTTGEVVRLHSATYKEQVLYQVQEVYWPLSFAGGRTNP